MRTTRALWVVSGALASSLACNSSTGVGLAVTDEPPGSNCAAGGVKIETGPDSDGDGAPDTVESTLYLCDGQDGEDGADAVATLTEVAPEAPGAACEDGGVRIDTGADADASGTLSAEEISSTQYVCDGTAAVATLTVATDEPAGANCSEGGIRLDIGPDANADGVLAADEIATTSYVCDGDPAGGGFIRTAYRPDAEIVSDNGAPRLLQSVFVTVPGPGQILVLGTVEAWCTPSAEPNCASSGPTRGSVILSDRSSWPSFEDVHSQFDLAPGITESISRTALFSVRAAGNYVYDMHGGSVSGSSVGYYRPQLTLIYLPE